MPSASSQSSRAGRTRGARNRRGRPRAVGGEERDRGPDERESHGVSAVERLAVGEDGAQELQRRREVLEEPERGQRQSPGGGREEEQRNGRDGAGEEQAQIQPWVPGQERGAAGGDRPGQVAAGQGEEQGGLDRQAGQRTDGRDLPQQAVRSEESRQRERDPGELPD